MTNQEAMRGRAIKFLTERYDLKASEIDVWEDHIVELVEFAMPYEEKLKVARHEANCGGIHIGKVCSDPSELGHKIYGVLHQIGEDKWLCEFHHFKQEVASRDARIAELEKAAMAQSSVGTITYTTSIGQSIPQDEWELRRKRTLAEEEG